ncbi:hypothetical protein OROGR_021297 [Orobanche gracilis]
MVRGFVSRCLRHSPAAGAGSSAAEIVVECERKLNRGFRFSRTA